jgi:cobalt/nickel transport system permease protein
VSPAIPAFLLERGVPSAGAPAPALGPPSRSVGTKFLDKGLEHLASVMRSSLSQGETSRAAGILQGVDARVKVLAALLFIIAVSLRLSLTAMIVVLACCLALSTLSRLGYGYVRRVALLAFAFGFTLAAPSAFNIVVDGTVVYPLLHLESAHTFWVYQIPQTIGVTREGLLGVARLTLRVADSLAISLLVLHTTPFAEVMRALKVLRVPDTFLLVVTLSYKYIFIFAQTAEEMHFAKKSRLVGGVDAAGARGWVVGRIGLLFRKTQLRCEEIYKAMLARGFSGEVRLAPSAPMRPKDWAWGAGFFAAAVLLFTVKPT